MIRSTDILCERARLKDLLHHAQSSVDFTRRDGIVGNCIGCSGLFGFAVGWWLSTWYYAFGLLLLVGVAADFAVSPYRRKLADELSTSFMKSLVPALTGDGPITLTAAERMCEQAMLDPAYREPLLAAIRSYRSTHPDIVETADARTEAERAFDEPFVPDAMASKPIAGTEDAGR